MTWRMAHRRLSVLGVGCGIGLGCAGTRPVQHPSTTPVAPAAVPEPPEATVTRDATTEGNPSPLVFHNVETEVRFQGWDKKGLGNVMSRERVSVILSPAGAGDIVILRGGPGRALRAEVYRADAASKAILPQYQLVSEDVEKVLSEQQQGKYYIITELVSGQQGGRRTESFTLPERAR